MVPRGVEGEKLSLLKLIKYTYFIPSVWFICDVCQCAVDGYSFPFVHKVMSYLNKQRYFLSHSRCDFHVQVCKLSDSIVMSTNLNQIQKASHILSYFISFKCSILWKYWCIPSTSENWFIWYSKNCNSITNSRFTTTAADGTLLFFSTKCRCV